jgi:AraC-like DNA-binding protein
MPTLLSVDRIGPYHGSQPHAHDCWEIGLYLSGRGTADIGASHVPFSRGTVICFPPFIPHRERAENACRGFFLTADQCPFGDGTAPLHADHSRSDFFQLVTLLHREWRQKKPRWQDATGHLFSLLLLHLERACAFSRSVHPLVDRLRREIETCVADTDFQAGAALSRLPMSPDHLRRLFVQQVGRTPHAYLNELRLTRAKHLLREGRWRVKEVAAQVGIPDEYYFSRLFLRHTGLRPRDYRPAAHALPSS